jgi:murein DD-endopeptidase MepM/ murein hydrolase activator NlpD
MLAQDRGDLGAGMPYHPHIVAPRGVAGRIVLALMGLVLLAIGWRLTGQDQATSATRSPPTANAPARSPPIHFTLRVAPGESLANAAREAGVSAADASAAEQLVGPLDRRGASFEAAISADPAGQARLLALTLRTGPLTTLHLQRAFDGALHVESLQETAEPDTAVAIGRLSGSLYASALRAGADDAVIGATTRLLSHRLDFQRDLHDGDGLRLVFDRRIADDGRTVQTGLLRYAEIDGAGGVTRLYAFSHDGQLNYFDGSGRAAGGLLLRTPVDGARITSGYGMRFHPLLGYTRMHQGVDFGAPVGTPVFAAGDGVITEAGRHGGYGNWLRIQHASGWDTGYGHLLRYAPGIAAGVHVRQGQLVAFVGSTGLSTGPHLHYEVYQNGEHVNPIGANVPQGILLTGAELHRFMLARAHIDALVTAAIRRDDGLQLASRMTDPTVLGLRPALSADVAYGPGRTG